MLRIMTVLIFTLFSIGAMGTICSVYPPSDCIAILDSDISFYEDIQSKYPTGKQMFLDIEITCTINLKLEHVDNLKVGDIFRNHKKYKVSVAVNSRLESYIIDFMKNNKTNEVRFEPHVVCNK